MLSLPSARTLYDVITFFTALYLGLLVYISAHLVTSSARRTGADPQLAASALSSRQRQGGALPRCSARPRSLGPGVDDARRGVGKLADNDRL